MEDRIQLWLIGAGAIGFAFGCGLFKDTTPDDVTLSAPTVILGKNAERVEAHVVNRADEPIADLAVAFSATPSTVAEISPSGLLKCRSSGEVVVRAEHHASGASFAQEATVRCRIVESIRGPGSVEVVVGSPESAKYIAISDLGAPMDDVPVEVTATDETVARWSDGKVTGLKAGATRLRLAAGGISGEADIAVFEELTVRLEFDSAKSNGDGWDSQLSGSAAPDPFIRIDGRTYMMRGGESECSDAYRCETTLRTQSPGAALDIEVWDDDFSDDDYAGHTTCSRGRECPTGQGVTVSVK